MSLPNRTLFEQRDRARPSVHQEADCAEPRIPISGGGVAHNRRLRGNACDPQRSGPLGRERRCRRATPVHPYDLRHRRLALTEHARPRSILSFYLQHIPCTSCSGRSPRVNRSKLSSLGLGVGCEKRGSTPSATPGSHASFIGLFSRCFWILTVCQDSLDELVAVRRITRSGGSHFEEDVGLVHV